MSFVVRAASSGLQVLGALQRAPEALRFERAADDPRAAQEALLGRTLAGLRGTRQGEALGLDAVRSLADLRDRVPVHAYADVEPLVRRSMNGEADVLTREAPEFFASSTGTTGAPKRTPVTPSFRRDFQRTVHVSMTRVLARHPRAATGKVLYFVGRRDLERTPSGVDVGFTSGFTFTTLPPLVQRLYAWPYALFAVPSLDARAYVGAWLAAQEPVTMIAGVFPLALLGFLRAVEPLADDLARDLARGTLRDDLPLPPELRHALLARARPRPDLADRLRAESRAHGGSLPATALFPDLALVYCWTGASAAHYVPELAERFGPRVAIRDGIYAANEAWMNVTFGGEELGGPAAITSHVLELVPETAWDAGERRGVLVHEAEPGARYRVLVTTSAGLLRYDVGDVVECTGRFRRTPCLRFARRGGASLSVAGEKLDESHVGDAVARATARTGLRPVFFTAVPRFLPRPRWELALEVAEGTSDAALEAFRAALDVTLGEAADDYRIYRGTGALVPLALRVLPPGASEAERRAKIAAGAPEAQLKVVLLQTEPSWLDGRVVARTVEAGPS